MPVELFERVVSHLSERGFIGEYINLYNWGESLLHPRLGRILEICREKKLRPILSTNLSVPETLLEPLEDNEVELLLVSLSGFSKDTYGRNHIGGDFDLVQRNLENLAGLRSTAGKVVIKYLLFGYNAHEIESARSFAEEHGFGFGVYSGAIHCAESYFRLLEDEEYRRFAGRYLDIENIDLRPTRYCPQETTITIDHRAELERCCASWQQGLQVSVFDADIRDHLEHKTVNRFCARCLASGYSHYTHFGVMSPESIRYNQ
jgi:MoaA/NifB/PqqE/SkfB family radical SAM enzyme